MNGRSAFLGNHQEFQYSPPAITAVTPSQSAPPMNDPVWILATVSNATNVYLGYRNSILHKFFRFPMYDDGLHGDGAASDGVYGAAMMMETPQMQYYVYAENANAGMFSPQRAEHEFYTLNAAIPVINPGDLVINEFMALNDSWVQAPNGDYEDWIEIYNNSPNTLALNNLYLSDSYNNPLKFKFPDNLTLASHDYLIVWADYDTTNTTGLHGGFKLSGGGERIMISYPGIVIDSISFGQQQSDISNARCPNGSGPFQFLNPTLGTANCNASGVEDLQADQITLYPNPATNSLFINTSVAS